MPVVDRARVAAALPAYTIGGEIGSGGYGLVLTGHHRDLDRQVAVKVVSTASAGPAAAADFRAEARMLSMLDHPHIVRTYDYTGRGDLCLLIMELLPGGTLARRRLPPAAACAVILAVADALAHAHALGILHRDVKPSNILFTAAGEPKITDFGISRVFAGSAFTASRVIGTPRYMAPEQIAGERLSRATDVYALGVVLYELLAGMPPIDPTLSLPELLRQHREVVPPPPPGVPGPLARVVLRCLAKKPEERYQSAAALAQDLARAATLAFGRGWLERCGVPIQISEDLRRITTWGRARSALAASLRPREGRVPRTARWIAAAAVATLVLSTAGWALFARDEPAPVAAPPPPPPPLWQPAGLDVGEIGTAFGSGRTINGFSGDGGPAVFAEFEASYGMAVDGRGNFLVADSGNNRIRRIDSRGIVTTIAGTGEAGFSGDGGPATAAQLDNPYDLAVAPDGTIYIADLGNERVRRIDPSGVITTVAGSGESGYGGLVSNDDPFTYSGDDLPAVQAKFSEPNSVLLDEAGNLYISDGLNNRVRRVDTRGVITTIAGTGADGYGGDGGPATAAKLSTPCALAFGPGGELYIAEQGNQRIRRVDSRGVITTVAGTGPRRPYAGGREPRSTGDGKPATQAELTPYLRLAVDAGGVIYLTAGAQIRQIDTRGIISTIAGTGQSGSSGNLGPATEAELSNATSLVVHAGYLYFADSTYGVTRAIRLVGPTSSSAAPTSGPAAPTPGPAGATAGPVPSGVRSARASGGPGGFGAPGGLGAARASGASDAGRPGTVLVARGE